MITTRVERLALARRPLSPDLQRYEREKQRWAAAHPEATPEEYQAAITRLAKECRV
jgi:hypothetical protein